MARLIKDGAVVQDGLGDEGLAHGRPDHGRAEARARAAGDELAIIPPVAGG